MTEREDPRYIVAGEMELRIPIQIVKRPSAYFSIVVRSKRWEEDE